MKPQAPCRDCVYRVLNCHSTCILYQDYQQELDVWHRKVSNGKYDEYEDYRFAKRKRKWR